MVPSILGREVYLLDAATTGHTATGSLAEFDVSSVRNNKVPEGVRVRVHQGRK